MRRHCLSNVESGATNACPVHIVGNAYISASGLLGLYLPALLPVTRPVSNFGSPPGQIRGFAVTAHLPASAEMICTEAIWSIGIELLPRGDVGTLVGATQVASWVWLPSRPIATIARVSAASSPA